MSASSIERAALSPAEKRALLAELLRKKVGGQAVEFPLSYGQKALLYLTRLQPGTPVYNTMFVIRVDARISIDVLRTAFQRIIDRHAALRTTYALKGEHFVQQVHATWEADFEACDACMWDENHLEARLVEDGCHPYDLQRNSVIRLKVYSRSPESHVLLLGVHHIVFDYWSYDVFAHELTELYACIQEGGQSALSPLRWQFTDFVQRQQDMLTSPRGEKLLQYWQRELAGEIPALNLPTDRVRPTIQTHTGSSFNFSLEDELAGRLRVLANEKDLTLYVLLLAAFQVLLHRYTGQDDILIGSPMVCRDSVQCEDLIGYFSNVVPLRANLAGDPSFNCFVAQVRETVLGALEHQDYPFPLIVELIAPSRDPSRSPLIDAVFSWEKSRYGARRQIFTEGKGITGAQLPLHLLYARQLGSPFDVTLLIFEGQERVSGTVLYNSDLFNPERIARMAANFTTLLGGIVDNSAQRVSKLRLISSEERMRLVVNWNATSTSYPRELSLQKLFESQVERTPGAQAVVFGEQCVSYRELNRRANQLAWYLKKRGVGPGVLVGVCLERSAEMVIALLAILKAGGAYVPLDPTYPKERLTFMLVDSQAPVVLAEEGTRGRWLEDWGEVVWIDREASRIREKSETNPEDQSNGGSLAYVMYTSGSTGAPKGIEIRQRGVSRLVMNTDYVELGPEDRIAQTSNTSFDAATFEIWGALLNGAQLVGVSKDVVLSARAYAEEIRRREITTLFLTTALFNELAREAPWMFSGVRQVLFGGEAVKPHWVAQVLREGKPGRLLHVYGPTETTTFATWYQVEDVQEGATTVPIGRPIANTRVYVLDGQEEPVPIGMTGELYIGGDGVARGYLNRPELTTERFVEDRFSSETGTRLYRTGDLVRYRADGNLEFLGRADQQVKIRGFRVELEEIETVLRKHPEVREAVVLAREGTMQEKRLVAYLVLRGHEVGTSEFRCWVKERLPEYMTPSAFLYLERLPLNANGKLDKQALPAPEQRRPDLNEPFAAAESDMEQIIAGLWKAALGLQEVGRYDNFFDLGGHSLLVAQIHAKLEKAVGRSVAIVDIFRHPTISTLAKHLNEIEAQDRLFDEVHARAHQQKMALAQRVQALQSRRTPNE